MATTTVDASELAGHLSEFLRRVEQGEEILVEVEGSAVARILPVEGASKPRRRQLGTARGRIIFHEGWDAPLSEEELKEWYGDDETE